MQDSTKASSRRRTTDIIEAIEAHRLALSNPPMLCSSSRSLQRLQLLSKCMQFWDRGCTVKPISVPQRSVEWDCRVTISAGRPTQRKMASRTSDAWIPGVCCWLPAARKPAGSQLAIRPVFNSRTPGSPKCAAECCYAIGCVTRHSLRGVVNFLRRVKRFSVQYTGCIDFHGQVRSSVIDLEISYSGTPESSQVSASLVCSGGSQPDALS